jgi:hypothetical protein
LIAESEAPSEPTNAANRYLSFLKNDIISLKDIGAPLIDKRYT